MRLLKKREETQQKAEKAREEIENETKKRKFSSIEQKFGGSHADKIEEEFKNQTIGLMSVAEFRAKKAAIDALIEEQKKGGKAKVKQKTKVNTKKLSFEDQDMEAMDSDGSKDSDEEAEEKVVVRKKSFGKDPTVNTAFLYDIDREADLMSKKKALTDEYHANEKEAKGEKLEVTYSYWDGTGHRRTCVVTKGFTINQFVAKAKADLEKNDFPELRTVPLEGLMYVKEDLIIPANVTFHQLIKDKAKGKSGPLFNFDVHADLSAGNINVQRDDSHAGKIVDKKWYERNRHIFPACRWEFYSKDKTNFDKEQLLGAEKGTTPDDLVGKV